MTTPKVVAGLDCFEVLARLSDYLDGALSEAERTQVIAHVSGCTVCASFGDRFAAAIAAVKADAGPREVPKDVQQRLRERLRAR